MTSTVPAEIPPMAILQGMRMPPFPAPPPGVVIAPFKDFQPSGILVPVDDLGEEIEPDDEAVECDALGIPTVILRVKHTVDTSEKAKRRKKKKGLSGTATEHSKPTTWWEAWEETETFRRNAQDQNLPPSDRLARAAEDFAAGRTMTVFVSGLWDQFKVYTGLLVHTNQLPKSDGDDDEDSVGEEVPPREKENDDDGVVEAEATDAPSTSKSTQPVLDEASRKNDIWADFGAPLADRFVEDPERSIGIFFSSHFRDKGLLWSPQRCVDFPILIQFFLRYLVRCRTFQEPHIDKAIRRALDIANLACAQLPTSRKIGLTLPDDFSSGCRSIWGSKRPTWADTTEQDPALAQDVEAQERTQTEAFARAEEEEKERKANAEARKKKEEEERAAQLQEAASSFESELKTAAAPETNNWDANADGEDIIGGSWGGSKVDDGVVWGDLPPLAWGGVEVDKEGSVEEQWSLPETSLLSFLGPSALPLTHRSAIVEKSTRRIVSILSPAAERACKVVDGPSAEAVEEELSRRCARVVLEPWPRAELPPNSQIDRPVILPASRGKLDLAGSDDVEGHAPLRDQITVLVEPASAAVLEPAVGMGLGATWIQLVRTEEGQGQSTGNKHETFWYMEELFQQIPSYHIDMTDEDDL